MKFLVLLWPLFLLSTASAEHYDLFVLTGQSNALGTTAGTEADVSPGADPADAMVKFFWDNRASASISLGNSAGVFTTLQQQQGGYYSGSSSHWGPEISFARTLCRGGVRNFGMIKAARGGGGNSYWNKESADHHMYDHVVATVQTATADLTTHGHTFTVRALLYLQGESDSDAEAAVAGARLKILVDQLRVDLPNATAMHGIVAGIAAEGSTRDVVRAQQMAIASNTDYIDYFDTLDLQPKLYDGLHYNKSAKITLGERFAAAVFEAGLVSRHYGKLMFLGDSITQGGNGRPSYRYQVFQQLAYHNIPQDVANGYLFVGSVQGAYQSNAGTTPAVNGQSFTNTHEGHFGWRASWINGRNALPADRRSDNRGEGTLLNWTAQANPQLYQLSNPSATVDYPDATASNTGNVGTSYLPDTVIIMVGVNDLADNNNGALQLRDDIALIIDQLRAANSLVRIHLCEILPTNQTAAMATAIQNLNALLPALIQTKNVAAPNSPVWLVPVHAGFDAIAMTYDQVHPNALGESFLAQRVAASLGLMETPQPSAVSTTVVADALGAEFFTKAFKGNQIWNGTGYVSPWTESGSLSKSLVNSSELRLISGTGAASWIEGTASGWSGQSAGSWTMETRVKCLANPNGFAMWLGTGTKRIIVEVMANATRDSGANTFQVAHNNLDGNFHTFRIVHDAVNEKYHVFRDSVRLTPLPGVTYDANAADSRLIIGDYTSGVFGNQFDIVVDYIRYEMAGAYLPVNADIDGDGLSDAWEWKWFGSFTNGLPNADDDGDGYNNFQEQSDGSNPWSPNSYGVAASSAAVSQVAAKIPRFGAHTLLRLAVHNPSTTPLLLSELEWEFSDGCHSSIDRVRWLDSGFSASVAASTAVLWEKTQPDNAANSLALNLTIAPGTRYLWLVIEPSRKAALGSVIDAKVTSFTMNGQNLFPDPGNPAGALTLDLVPLFSDVRVSGEGNIHTYRIPGIACDAAGVLHAVYDHRYASGADLPANVDVGYARSRDGGVTWSSSKVIMDYDASVAGSQGNGVGDPCILYDPTTDTLWVAALWSFGNHGYSGSGAGTAPTATGQYVLSKSTDGGDNWSAPINITSAVKDDSSWRLIFQGPGHGFVTRDGTLVFPSQRINASGVVQSGFIFSSDHGSTWDFGSVVTSTSPQTNEVTGCELDDGRLLFTMRTPSGSNGQRAWAYYTRSNSSPYRDGTWSSIYRTPAVPCPVCQASVIQWRSAFKGQGGEILLYAGPGTSSARTRMTLRLSADAGQTWPVARELYAGLSAYSSLCILPDDSVGILFEKDDYTRLTFARVEKDWLMQPELDADTDGLPDAWENLYSVFDPSADADSDGVSNIDEWRAGTHPRASSSRLQALAFDRQDASIWQFRWKSVAGELYQIETSTDLQQWQVAGVLLAYGNESSWLVTDPSKQTFVRAVVIK